MTSTKEDDVLNEELQELYLISKHWISDLEFLTGEIDFLKKLVFGKTFYPLIQANDLEKVAETLIKAEWILDEQSRLKSGIFNHLQTLKPYVLRSIKNYNVSLIELHSQLDNQLRELMLDFISVKNVVFDMTIQRLKKNNATPELY
jgi:hypothetical protein